MRHDEISRANEHVEALQELRALCVAVRRERVLDSVRLDLPAGHERRLIDIQSAILAIDEAIRDEQILALRSAQTAAGEFRALPTLPIAAATLERPSEAAASLGGSAWRSYEDWRCSSKKAG